MPQPFWSTRLHGRRSAGRLTRVPCMREPRHVRGLAARHLGSDAPVLPRVRPQSDRTAPPPRRPGLRPDAVSVRPLRRASGAEPRRGGLEPLPRVRGHGRGLEPPVSRGRCRVAPGGRPVAGRGCAVGRSARARSAERAPPRRPERRSRRDLERWSTAGCRDGVFATLSVLPPAGLQRPRPQVRRRPARFRRGRAAARDRMAAQRSRARRRVSLDARYSTHAAKGAERSWAWVSVGGSLSPRRLLPLAIVRQAAKILGVPARVLVAREF